MLTAFERTLAKVKEQAPSLTDYAYRLTALKPNGLRLVGFCPNPKHDDRTPSFNIYPESATWWCFGACSRGGDILDLFMMVEGWPEGQYGPALAAMAQKFNVQLPQRPDSWFEWQEEKNKRYRLIRDALTASYQRRYFRVFGTHLKDIGDPDERRAEAQRFFDDLRVVAMLAAEWRLSK